MSPGTVHARCCTKKQEPNCLAQLDTAQLPLCHTETDTSGKLMNRHFTNVMFAILHTSLALTRHPSHLSSASLSYSSTLRHTKGILSLFFLPRQVTSINYMPSEGWKQIFTVLNLTILCSRRTKTVRTATAVYKYRNAVVRTTTVVYK